MQGVCDHRKIFIDVVIGWPGSAHDARVWRNSELYRKAMYQYEVSIAIGLPIKF